MIKIIYQSIKKLIFYKLLILIKIRKILVKIIFRNFNITKILKKTIIYKIYKMNHNQIYCFKMIIKNHLYSKSMKNQINFYYNSKINKSLMINKIIRMHLETVEQKPKNNNLKRIK